MKEKFVFSCIFFSVILFSQQKAEIRVDYQSHIMSDTLSHKFVTADFVLLASASKSFFSTPDLGSYMEKMRKFDFKSSNLSGMPIRPKTMMGFTRNGNAVSSIQAVNMQNFLYEEPELKWSMINEFKDVLGYRCQLAKTMTDTGQTYYAWFTNDIPIPDGPFRFKGLSGLILEVFEKFHHFDATAVAITKSNESLEPVKYFVKIIKTKKSDFLSMRKSYYANPEALSNIKVTDDEGHDMMRATNNRIKNANFLID